MKLEELKEQWSAYDQQLEANLSLHAQSLRQSGLRLTQTALQWLSLPVLAELLLGVVTLVLLGSFMGQHLSELAFFAPALLLALFVLGQLAFSIYQLLTLNGLDFSRPILTNQKKLATLRLWRIRVTLWTLLLSPLLWVPLLIVALKGLLGINVYTTFSTAWLVTNFLFGMAVIPLLLWVAHRYSDRWQQSSWMQRLLDDIAGRNLSAAVTFLEELASFAEEGDAPMKAS